MDYFNESNLWLVLLTKVELKLIIVLQTLAGGGLKVVGQNGMLNSL